MMSLPKHVQDMKAELHRKGTLAFRVVSSSMEPVIMTGNPILVHPTGLEALKRFDIILFWNGRLLICHYLWHVNSFTEPNGSKMMVTRPLLGFGRQEDLPTPSTHLIGRVGNHRIPTWTKLRILWNSLGRF